MVDMMSLRGDAGVLDETSVGRLLRNPTFFVLEQLARLKPFQSVTVSNARHVVALASACDDQAAWLIANLTAEVVDLTVSGDVPARIMDAVAWQAFASGRATSPWQEFRVGHAGALQLDAFAIAIVSP